MKYAAQYLGIDYGDKRLGLALANSIAKMPAPLGIIANDDNTIANLKTLINEKNITKIIIGLPRNLSGEETGQAAKTRKFARLLERYLNRDVIFCDESLSSVRAEDYYAKSKIKPKYHDDIAACYILEEFLKTEKSQ